MDKYEAIAEAFRQARANGSGYAFAVYSPPNPNFPEGLWQVARSKPLLRTREWVVIECTADGKQVLA